MATTETTNLYDVEREVREAIHRHWILFLIQGLILIALGLLAIGEPMVATIAVTLFAGWLFLIGGAVGLAGIFTARRVPGFWWSLISALLAIAIGVYLIRRPLSGVLSLTLAVALFFGAEGISQIITAIGQRRALGSWGWVLISGIANLVLAAIIWSGFPSTAEWVLGLMFGINLLLWGFALVMTALASRSA
jgi:uncharacterized membrane protein HdeD (DUF308 family)